MRRNTAALIAGSIAIAVNTALLLAADAVGFVTARGGLLRLLKNFGGAAADTVGAEPFWRDVVLPATAGRVFQNVFHVVVGLLMALFYAAVVGPRLRGTPWQKGAVYGAAVWLVNALIVLPLLAEGVAGSRYLGAAGIIGFAVIHTVFFVLLGVLYARLHSRQGVS